MENCLAQKNNCWWLQLILVCFLFLGCQNSNRKILDAVDSLPINGTYLSSHGNGVEMFFVRSNFTFEQIHIDKAGRITKTAGSWVVKDYMCSTCSEPRKAYYFHSLKFNHKYSQFIRLLGIVVPSNYSQFVFLEKKEAKDISLCFATFIFKNCYSKNKISI